MYSYRIHTCLECKYRWDAEVVCAQFTANLSGEKKEQCPKCNSKSIMSGPIINLEVYENNDWEGMNLYY